MPSVYNASPIYGGKEEIKYQVTADNGPVWNGLYRIRFFDIDGTVLKIEYAPIGREIIAPDEDPSFDSEYLTFDGWNYDIDNLTVEGPMDIGALYNTKDYNRIYYINTNNIVDYNGNVSIVDVKFYVRRGGTIYWGDGTSTTNDTDSVELFTLYTHIYDKNGKYIVYGNNIDDPETSCQHYVERAYFKNTESVPYNNSPFSKYNNLQIISLPSTLVSTSDIYKVIDLNSFRYCRSLKHITIPNYITKIKNQVFDYALIDSISLPNSLTDIKIKGRLSKGIIIPKNVTSFSGFSSIIAPDLYFNTTKITDFSSSMSAKLYFLRIPEGVTTISNPSYSSGATNIQNLLASTAGTVIFPTTYTTNTSYFNIAAGTILNLILLSPTKLILTNAFSQGSKVFNIYVPDALVDEYKIDSLWAGVANKFKPLSQYEGDY